jgi:hypothetical protein
MSLLNIVIHMLFAPTGLPSVRWNWTIKFPCGVSKKKLLINTNFPGRIRPCFTTSEWATKDWHNRIGDMLAYVNDVLTPHGFDDIVKDD